MVSAAYGLIFYRYLDYRGRSPRSELWNFIINTLLIQLAIPCFLPGKSIVSFIFHIVAMIRAGGVDHVRRFHDIGYSGWYLLAIFVPFANFIALFVLLFFKSAPGENSLRPPATARKINISDGRSSVSTSGKTLS